MTATLDDIILVPDHIVIPEPVAPPPPLHEVPDPLGNIKIGDPIPDTAGYDVVRPDSGDHYGGGAGGACPNRTSGVPGHQYVGCDRPAGHNPHWPHVAARDGKAVAVWGAEPPPLPDEPQVFDDEGAQLDLATVKASTLLNYRDKADLLIVLNVMRPDPRNGADAQQVEVLDLTHRRFRRIPVRSLVPLRDEATALTAEQMKWVGEFVAERRQHTKAVAMRELANGRWDLVTMNSALLKLNMEAYQPPMAAVVNADMSIELPEGSDLDTRRKVQAAIKKALTDLEIEGLGKLRVTGVSGGAPEPSTTAMADVLAGLRF